MVNLPKFKNQELLEQALTHRSYLNESKKKLASNERLEFLGDSIMSVVISNYLYEKYPVFDEGKLTNLRSLLVNKKNFAEVATKIDLGQFLKLSKGEDESGGRLNQSLLADAFEAVIGALYLDQGIKAVEEFVNPLLFPQADIFIQKNALKDPKSLLQEEVQAKKHASPNYKVVAEEGPAHVRIFTVDVFVGNVLMGEGKGHSKQEAEEKAAEAALLVLKAK